MYINFIAFLGHIDMNKFKGFKIIVPSIERQKEIVEYCEYNDTLIKQLEKEIENNKKHAHQFILSIVKAQPIPQLESASNDLTINDNSDQQPPEETAKKVKKIIKIKRLNVQPKN